MLDENGRVSLRSLAGRTLLNGKELRGTMMLKVGDSIGIGSRNFFIKEHVPFKFKSKLRRPTTIGKNAKKKVQPEREPLRSVQPTNTSAESKRPLKSILKASAGRSGAAKTNGIVTVSWSTPKKGRVPGASRGLTVETHTLRTSTPSRMRPAIASLGTPSRVPKKQAKLDNTPRRVKVSAQKSRSRRDKAATKSISTPLNFAIDKDSPSNAKSLTPRWFGGTTQQLGGSPLLINNFVGTSMLDTESPPQPAKITPKATPKPRRATLVYMEDLNTPETEVVSRNKDVVAEYKSPAARKDSDFAAFAAPTVQAQKSRRGLPTPLKRAIRSRPARKAKPAMKKVLATPLKKAIQTHERQAKPAMKKALSTPVRKAIRSQPPRKAKPAMKKVLATPLKKAIQTREPVKYPEKKKALSTPVRKAIRSQPPRKAKPAMKKVLATPLKKAIQTRERKAKPAMKKVLATPLKKAIQTRKPVKYPEMKKALSTPVRKAIRLQPPRKAMPAMKEVLATPLKKAIQTREPVKYPEKKKALSTPVRKAIRSQPPRKAKPAMKKVLATPLKKAIQTREPVKYPEKKKALSTPVRKAIRSQPPRKAKPAMKKVLATPLKKAIQTRERKSKPAMKKVLATPLKKAIQTRKPVKYPEMKKALSTPVRKAIRSQHLRKARPATKRITPNATPKPRRATLVYMEDLNTPETEVVSRNKDVVAEYKSVQTKKSRRGLPTPLKRAIRSQPARKAKPAMKKVLATPLKKAIKSRKPISFPEKKKALSTPVRKAIRNHKGVTVHPMKKVLATPLKKAIQTREPVKYQEKKKALSTPVRKAIRNHKGVSVPEKKKPINTPLRKAIVSRSRQFASRARDKEAKKTTAAVVEKSTSPSPAKPATPAKRFSASPAPKSPVRDVRAELKQLRVVDLRKRLGSFGLSKAGRKAELIERLFEAMSVDEPEPQQEEAPQPEQPKETKTPPASPGADAKCQGGIQLRQLRVVDLRKRLKDRGLSTRGRKAELVERLAAVIAGDDAAAPELEVDQDPPVKKSTARNKKKACSEKPAPVRRSRRLRTRK